MQTDRAYKQRRCSRFLAVLGELKGKPSGSRKTGTNTCAPRCHGAWQTQLNPSQPNWTQPSPTQLSPGQPNEPTQRGLCSSSFPSIRYTQGKQEGIRMGPDRHLVCWEISLGWSERLPSLLPAPAHQMWGEGHIARSLGSVVCVHFLSVFLTLDSTDILYPCEGIYTHL